MTDRQMNLSFRASLWLAAAFCFATPASAQVVISSDATANMSCSGGVCSPTAESAVLNVTDLENLLASGNVEITTTDSGAQANDIQITSSFSWSSANSLTLDAYQSVLFAQPVAVDGSAGVSLITNDGGSGGTLSFNPGGNLTFAQTTNALSINGQSYVLEKSLKALAAAIGKNPSGYFALAKSDNARGKTYKSAPITTTFSGSLNGLGNAITGLTINSASENTGLFSEVDNSGTISSLALLRVTIKVAQALNSDYGVGGFVGGNFGVLFNDYTSGKISARVRDFLFAGGIAGGNQGTIINSASSVSIDLVSGKHADTLAATGGISGENLGTIADSFAMGDAGSAKGSDFGSALFGGLVGSNDGGIQDCYATGSTTIPNTRSGAVGGLVGQTSTAVIASYSTGAPSAEAGGDIGGFIGADGSNGQLADDYWDTTTSGITNLSQGAGNISNDPGIAGDTTAQLQSGLPSGFDPSIWAEDSTINNGLPYLIANPPRN